MEVCVCTHVFRIKMQNLKCCEAPAADVPWGSKLWKLNAESSFKSVATSLTAQDNDDDTIPSKPLAADKSGRGMYKNSFLNGHKRCRVHIGAVAIGWAKIENLSKG